MVGLTTVYLMKLLLGYLLGYLFGIIIILYLIVVMACTVLIYINIFAAKKMWAIISFSA